MTPDQEPNRGPRGSNNQGHDNPLDQSMNSRHHTPPPGGPHDTEIAQRAENRPPWLTPIEVRIIPARTPLSANAVSFVNRLESAGFDWMIGQLKNSGIFPKEFNFDHAGQNVDDWGFNSELVMMKIVYLKPWPHMPQSPLNFAAFEKFIDMDLPGHPGKKMLDACEDLINIGAAAAFTSEEKRRVEQLQLRVDKVDPQENEQVRGQLGKLTIAISALLDQPFSEPSEATSRVRKLADAVIKEYQALNNLNPRALNYIGNSEVNPQATTAHSEIFANTACVREILAYSHQVSSVTHTKWYLGETLAKWGSRVAAGLGLAVPLGIRVWGVDPVDPGIANSVTIGAMTVATFIGSYGGTLWLDTVYEHLTEDVAKRFAHTKDPYAMVAAAEHIQNYLESKKAAYIIPNVPLFNLHGSLAPNSDQQISALRNIFVQSLENGGGPIKSKGTELLQAQDARDHGKVASLKSDFIESVEQLPNQAIGSDIRKKWEAFEGASKSRKLRQDLRSICRVRNGSTPAEGDVLDIMSTFEIIQEGWKSARTPGMRVEGREAINPENVASLISKRDAIIKAGELHFEYGTLLFKRDTDHSFEQHYAELEKFKHLARDVADNFWRYPKQEKNAKLTGLNSSLLQIASRASAKIHQLQPMPNLFLAYLNKGLVWYSRAAIPAGIAAQIIFPFIS